MFKKLKSKTSALASNVSAAASNAATNISAKVSDKEKPPVLVVQPADHDRIKGGFVVAVGSNHMNQFAMGGPKASQETYKTPVALSTTYAYDIAYVAAGSDHIYYATKDGKLHYTGSNKVGQLGTLNAPKDDGLSPLNNAKVNPKSVVCGQHHTVLLGDKGAIYYTGKGDLSGIPVEDNKYTPQPIPVLANKKIEHYATGPKHSVAVDELGNVFAWGRGDLLGIGSFVVVKKITTTKKEPVLVECSAFLNFKVVSIACGDEHTLALLQNGCVYAWGRGEEGQLGHGVKDSRQSPILVDQLRDLKLKSVSCGAFNSAAITVDNDCYVWGQYYTPKLTPEPLCITAGHPIKNVDQISQNGFYNIVLAQNQVYTFGADYKLSTEQTWTPALLKIEDPFLLAKKITQVIASSSNYYLIVYQGASMEKNVKIDYSLLGEKGSKNLPPPPQSAYSKNLESLLARPNKPSSSTTTTTTTTTTNSSSKSNTPSSTTPTPRSRSNSKALEDLSIDSHSDGDDEEESVL
eukprot:gene6809-7914_t